jgi:phosphoenolpyruvate carboxykinase (ATP)
VAQHGLWNADVELDTAGLSDLGEVYWNFTAPALYEHAIARGEAQLVAGGALLADTGKHTGRSPKDKFIVRDATTKRRSGGTAMAR